MFEIIEEGMIGTKRPSSAVYFPRDLPDWILSISVPSQKTLILLWAAWHRTVEKMSVSPLAVWRECPERRVCWEFRTCGCSASSFCLCYLFNSLVSVHLRGFWDCPLHSCSSCDAIMNNYPLFICITLSGWWFFMQVFATPPDNPNPVPWARFCS